MLTDLVFGSRANPGRANPGRANPGRATPGRYRQALLLILLGLAILTVYINYRRQPNYELQVFTTPAGWGYTVLANGQALIYQPTVPGQAGAAGFATSDQARRAGERVVGKLRQGALLPTLTTAELDTLGVPSSGRSAGAVDTSHRPAGGTP